MRQKFSRLTYVRVAKKMPAEMWHFDADFTAIVNGTYSQIYGGKDVKSYALYVLKRGKVVNEVAWYPEELLTRAKNQNRRKAEKLIEDYNFTDDRIRLIINVGK